MPKDNKREKAKEVVDILEEISILLASQLYRNLGARLTE